MTLDELTTPLTVAEAEASIYAAFAARGLTTTTWKPGAVVRTIVIAFAILVAAFSSLQAEIAEGGFLLLAVGDWLTLVARYVYGVERDLGSFAAGPVTFVNASGNVYGGVAGDLVVSDSATGKQYRNTASYTIGAMATVDIPVQAIELGSGSSAGATEIDTLVTSLIGVTCSNAAAILGTDPEDDDTLRLRCSEKTGTLSPNGPRDAYAFMARTATLNGVSCGVTRIRAIADGFGNVAVYVASGSGTISGASGNPATALGAVHKRIQENAVPLAVTETTASATAHVIDVTYEYWLLDTTSLTDGQIEDKISTALAAFMAVRPIGGDLQTGGPPTAGKVYVSAIEGVIAAQFAQTVRVSVTIPAADVSITATQAPVFGTPTATIHQVAEDLI